MPLSSSQPPAGQLAVAALKQSRTRDFDEQATLLHGWNQHYAQLSSGQFTGVIVELFFDDIHLFSESTSQALQQSGKLDQEVLALGIPLQVQERGVFCGETMQHNTIHLFSGTSGFEFYSPAHLTMGGIVIPRAILQSWMSEADFAASIEQSAQLRAVSPNLIRQARAFLFAMFDLCKHHPALLQSENFRRQLREATLACVADLLTNDEKHTEGLSVQRRWKIVQQAQDYLHAVQDKDSTLNIEMLCRELGISRRTLQYCFNDLVGMNPVAFLRAQRLNAVRQMLKESCSVTEAATTWGFWHFGHFSQEYKKLFGELPSATLRRSGSATIA
jgi:AraC family ethanolamine operon transcriptional activator